MRSDRTWGLGTFAGLLVLGLGSLNLSPGSAVPVEVGEASGRPAERLRAEDRAQRARENPRPFDAPDQAYRHFRSKRLRHAGSDFDPTEAYRRAEAHRRTMPRVAVDSRAGLAPVTAETAHGQGTRDARADWEWLGPGNIGGRTRTIAIHPNKPKIMYAGGVSGGVWKTTNRGKSWLPVGDQLANLAVNSLAMDPDDPKILYAGTGEGFFREEVRETSLPLRGGGIFRTTDAGSTWELLPATGKKAFHWVNDLMISPSDSRRLYAATRKGVYRSKNAGKRWKRILRPRTRGGCLDLELRTGSEGETLFASCGTLDQATVYRNGDPVSTKKWEAVLSEPGMGRTSLAIAPSDPDIMYAVAASNVPGPGGLFEQALHAVFRSTQGGGPGTWQARLRNSGGRKIDRVILSNPIIAFLEECGFQGPNDFFAMGWYVNLVTVDPTDADKIWVGGVDLFRSDDGGLSFNPVTYWWADARTPNFVHADHHRVVFNPKGKRLYSLNDGGVYELRNPRVRIPNNDLAVCSPGLNGGEWRSLNTNYGVTQFYHGSVYPDGSAFIAGAQDNGTLRGTRARGVNDWRRIFGGDGGYSAIDPVDTNVLYVTFQSGEVRKSVDGGRNFDDATVGITDLDSAQPSDFRAVGEGFLFIAPLVMDPSDTERLWLGGRRMWRTDDGAASWSSASSQFAGEKVSAIEIDPDDPDRVVIGTDQGFVRMNTNATSSIAGSIWPGTRPRAGFVSSVALDPADSQVIYATYATFGGDHVWRSVDGGTSWLALDGSGAAGLPDLPVHSIVVDPQDSERLFLGTDLGVFVSLDRGASWAVESGGLPAAVTEWVEWLETAEGERFLYAFTHGRGAWRLALD